MNLYRKKELQPLQPWFPNMNMAGVSVSISDKENGSPREGDMIAHDPNDPTDQWLVAAKFFQENYELAEIVVSRAEAEIEDFKDAMPDIAAGHFS